MSIQRYNTIHPHAYRAGIIKEPNGNFVLYTDHLAALARVTRERDEACKRLSLAEARATEGDLACEDCDWSGPVSDCKQSEKEPEGRCDCPECEGNAEGAMWWRQECFEKGAEADRYRDERDEILAERGALKRERDEAVEALRAYSTGTLPDYGALKIEGGWRLVIIGIQKHARAVLAKIEGGKS